MSNMTWKIDQIKGQRQRLCYDEYACKWAIQKKKCSCLRCQPKANLKGIHWLLVEQILSSFSRPLFGRVSLYKKVNTKSQKLSSFENGVKSANWIIHYPYACSRRRDSLLEMELNAMVNMKICVQLSMNSGWNTGHIQTWWCCFWGIVKLLRGPERPLESQKFGSFLKKWALWSCQSALLLPIWGIQIVWVMPRAISKLQPVCTDTKTAHGFRWPICHRPFLY